MSADPTRPPIDVTEPRHGLAAVAAFEAVLDGRRGDLLDLSIPDDADDRAALIVNLAELGAATMRHTLDYPAAHLEGLRRRYLAADGEAGR